MSIHIKLNASHKVCDLCGNSIGNKTCFGTSVDTAMDICDECVYDMYKKLSSSKVSSVVGTNKVAPQTLSTMLTSIAKRILDSDTKTLIKAGYLDNSLALTEEGGEALTALLLQKNLPELVKLADEKISDAEEAK